MEAFNNSTIKPAGPRTGTGNLSFFNIEGSGNGANASYGVMDFTLASVALGAGETISSVNQISLSLTESNAAFTVAGTLAFYLTADTSTIISNTGGSPLVFTGSDGAAAFGSSLAPNYFLGNGVFSTTGAAGSGTVDNYVLDLSTADSAAKSYLADLLTNGGTLRLIGVATTPTTAATFAGETNTSLAGPTVTVDYTVATVPEPGTCALLAVGGAVGVLVWRRRRTGVAQI